MITFPYIKGTTNKIEKFIKKSNIKVNFSPPNILKNMLDYAKDTIDLKHQKCVYTIPYLCGKHYIDEIGRSLQVRHIKCCVDINYNHVKRSILVEHSQDIDHLIFM